MGALPGLPGSAFYPSGSAYLGREPYRREWLCKREAEGVLWFAGHADDVGGPVSSCSRRDEPSTFLFDLWKRISLQRSIVNPILQFGDTALLRTSYWPERNQPM